MSNAKKITPVALHLFFCVVVFLVPLLVMSRSGEVDYRFYTGYVVRMGCLMLVLYINYLFLIDRLLFSKKIILYLAINLLLLTGIIFSQNLIADSLWKVVSGIADVMPDAPEEERVGDHKPPPLGMRLLGEYVFMMLFVSMSVALKATMRWYRDSINFEKVKASQLEADLRNLRNQLNPHFLFNTLNNIYSLVALDTQKAQDSIHRLSGLLRFVLYENSAQFVPMDKELEFTKNYIDLMALRLGANVRLNVDIRNNNCRREIASLMFMTLIENAFKHGISNSKDSFIEIQIAVDNDNGVLCTVANSTGREQDGIESKNSGIGLTNLRQRLELLYPDAHRLEVKKEDDRFSVILNIDFHNEKEKGV